jgi:hypothetical protein
MAIAAVENRANFIFYAGKILKINKKIACLQIYHFTDNVKSLFVSFRNIFANRIIAPHNGPAVGADSAC